MQKVSIIIPTYNRREKLIRAINSILTQDYKDFELIIVDDCSTDDTEEFVKDIDDERVIYHKLKQNSGAAGARNAGVKISSYDYIAFHDSDDEWMPDKLSKQMKYINENSEYAMVYTKMSIHQGDKCGMFPNDAVKGDLEGDLFYWLLIRNTIGAPTMLMKKECFDIVGGFDERLRCLEDWEFAVRFAKQYKIGYLDEALILVHSEPGGVSSNRGGYYETRCKMISQYKNEMIINGMFDDIVMDLFKRAEATGVLPQVQKMLITMLN